MKSDRITSNKLHVIERQWNKYRDKHRSLLLIKIQNSESMENC
jgi:hypothetical protein